MRIYLDLVILLNFLVDYLLLLGTNRLSGFSSDWKRLLAAAAIGGIYGGVCLLPGFRFLGNTLWRIVSLVGMAGLAFGWNRSMLRRCGVFVILAMALGGFAMHIDRIRFPGLILCAAGIWVLCRLAFGERIGGKEYIPLTITWQDRRVELVALRDSGNSLRDPVTGEQVLVISADAAQKLTGLAPEQLQNPLETLSRRPLPGLRLIPYHAVGNAGGMMLAMRFENVRLGNERQSAIVAFAAEGLGGEGMVQALAGGTI